MFFSFGRRVLYRFVVIIIIIITIVLHRLRRAARTRLGF